MKSFSILYKPIEKYGEAVERRCLIYLPKPTGDIGKDAHAALNSFVTTVGNLKKYDVLEIQELDENNKPVGEPIKPMGESSIVPTGR